MTKTGRALLVAGLSYASAVYGESLRFCPQAANNVCFSVAAPSSTLDSGSGNIYFQISAPTTYSWVAFGTGTGMSGSNMFLVYQDGAGNMTLSVRRGSGHNMPSEDTSSTASKLTLLAGSGVSSDGNTMVANMRCQGCESWGSGNTLSLTGQSDWIGGWREGASLATTSTSVQFPQHDDTTRFQLTLSQAALATDSNPFVGESKDGDSGSDGTGSGGDSDTGSGSGSGSGGNSGNGISELGGSPFNNSVLIAHGIILALVMAALYPLGSLLMPLLGNWRVHAVWQTISFILMWIGFGLGVQAAMDRDMLFQQTHTLLGTVVICLMVIQPALGYMHHRHFVATGGRGLVSYVHIWWGRALMLLGVINGGLGLQLSQERNSLVIAYSVVAAVIFTAYAVGKAFAVARRGKPSPKGISPTTTQSQPRRPYQEDRRNRAHRYV